MTTPSTNHEPSVRSGARVEASGPARQQPRLTPHVEPVSISTVLWVGGNDPCPSLRSDPRLAVIGPLLPAEVGESLGRVHEFTAAVIDVDIGDTAFETILQLNEAEFPCRSLIVGSRIEPAIVREAFFLGVQSCLRKPVDPRVLGAEIRRACEATVVMRRCIHAAGIDAVDEIERTALDTTELTAREREILQMVLEGRTTRRIAESLDVAPRTVKFHVSNLLHKLGCGSRLSLMAKIHRTGLG